MVQDQGEAALLDPEKLTLTDIIEFAIYCYYSRPNHVQLGDDSKTWEQLIPQRMEVAKQLLRRTAGGGLGAGLAAALSTLQSISDIWCFLGNSKESISSQR